MYKDLNSRTLPNMILVITLFGTILIECCKTSFVKLIFEISSFSEHLILRTEIFSAKDCCQMGPKVFIIFNHEKFDECDNL